MVAPAISGLVTVVTILDRVPKYAMANNVETSTALLAVVHNAVLAS